MSFSIIRPDGAVLVFDACLRESHSAELEATEHPLEDGAVIVDHVRRLPYRLAAEALINEAAGPGEGSLTETGIDRIRAALAFLRACERQPLRVVTDRLGTVENMLLTGYPHDVETVRNLPFSLRFVQARFAEQATVIIPPAAPRPSAQAGSPTATDVGAQATKDSTRDPSRDAANKSWLLQLVGG